MGLKIIRIIEKIIGIVLIGIIVILGFYIIQRIVNKEKDTPFLGYFVFEVSSWSMYNETSEQSLAKGDLIFVKKRKKEDYQVGMVVTYRIDEQEMPITHQIVEIHENQVITQGINQDGNTAPDTPFDIDNIIGEVQGVWHNYSTHIGFLKSPQGIICIILLGGILFGSASLIEKKVNKHK